MTGILTEHTFNQESPLLLLKVTQGQASMAAGRYVLRVVNVSRNTPLRSVLSAIKTELRRALREY